MKHNTLFSMTLLVVLFMLVFGSSSWIMGCTGIFFANSKTALAGNNEDWMSPFGRIWFIPAQGKKFGRVCFGFQEGGTQGAMNDQGLFFDGFALNPLEVKPVAGKEVYPGDLAQKALEECRTVDEVIALFERYDRQGLVASQFFVADKEGNSAIIEAEAIIRKQGDHQIVTNFRQSRVTPEAITDARYLIVRKMMEAKDKVDVDLFRRVLAAAHQEGKYPTQYTNICNLKTGIIYLYRFHNYEQVVRIDLRRELSKGRRVVELQSLFPASHAADFYKKEIEKTMAERLSKHQIVPLKPELANGLIGEYGFGSGLLAGYTIAISMQGNTLFAEVGSLLEKSQLYPLSDSEYVINGLEEIYSLQFISAAAAGKMKLRISMMGMEAEASMSPGG